MDRLIDYVKWYGDLDFTQKPFNEMDVLILCVVGYLDMKPVYRVVGTGTPDVKNKHVDAEDMIPRVPGMQKLSIREISRRIKDQGLKYYVRTVGPDNGQIDLQDAIAASRRFGDVMVRDYVDEFDAETSLQFSAMTFEAAGKRIISYCGTDHTIAGWKEDFMISFTHPQAQDKAVAYAEKAIRTCRVEQLRKGEEMLPFIISGHSKGGNLALYAACMMKDDCWCDVEHVYDLDGPGFCADVVDLSVLDRVQEKTTLIGPEYAIISKLFEADIKDKRIIRSDAEGMMQHGLYSWCTDHGAMALIDKHDPRSEAVSEVVDRWLKGLSTEERRIFVDELFDSLSAGGKAVTIDDIGAKGGPGYEEVLKNMLTMDEKVRKMAREIPLRAMVEKDVQLSIETTIEATVKAARNKGPVEWFLQNETAQGAAILLGGLLVMLSAGFIADILVILPMVVLCSFMAVLTIRRLYKNGWNFEEERLRVTLTILALGTMLVVILKPGAIDVLGTFLMGTMLLIFAYTAFLKIRHTDETFTQVILVMETLIGGLLGLSILLIPGEKIRLAGLCVGGFISVDGLLHVIHGRGK